MSDLMILARIAEGKGHEALAALAPFLVGKAELLTSVAAPEPPPVAATASPETKSTAREIAQAIKPTANQPTRLLALRAALRGYDTLQAAEGDPDFDVRGAIGALSRRMRPWAPHHHSPVEIITTRAKRLDPDSGAYLAMTYAPTPLGEAVLAELVDMGVPV